MPSGRSAITSNSRLNALAVSLGQGIEVSVGVTAAQVLAVGVGQAHADQFEVYLAATGIDLSHGAPVLVDGLGTYRSAQSRGCLCRKCIKRGDCLDDFGHSKPQSRITTSAHQVFKIRFKVMLIFTS